MVQLKLLLLASQEVQQALQEWRLPLQPAVAGMAAAGGRKLGHAPVSSHNRHRKQVLVSTIVHPTEW
jgi:hypothetical protein